MPRNLGALMGRNRQKGRAVTGWLIVDKPAGPTSTDIVNRMRRAFDARKAGHAGTLDPAATGLLAIAFGDATRVIPHVTDALKAYRFTVRFGQATDTDDAEGQVIATADTRPDDGAIEAALAGFRGDILQVPPQFSAVKVAGARAYDRARDGEAMVLAARPLRVERLEMVGRDGPDLATFEMVCGKGGYVRAIARDLGAGLGCLGHVVALRRLWSGPFDVADGVAPAAVEALDGPEARDALLAPLEAGLAGMPEARLSATGAVRVRNGNPGEVIATDAGAGEVAWASHGGRALAVGVYMGGMLHPDRVFGG